MLPTRLVLIISSQQIATFVETYLTRLGVLWGSSFSSTKSPLVQLCSGEAINDVVEMLGHVHVATRVLVSDEEILQKLEALKSPFLSIGHWFVIK